ncbi:MAG: DUF5979 domain-containing protein [Clostridiales bacterium]|nr:DUF5979 domain-containing protein [Clostridiales bacterium]
MKIKNVRKKASSVLLCAVLLCGFIPQERASASDYTGTDNTDAAAVIQKPDGAYAQYTTLREAVNAVTSADEVTIKIVRDMTVTEQIDIGNRKIRLEADEAHMIAFAIPDDAANRNCFRIAGYSTPTSLTIGKHLTVTTTNHSLRSIVNVGGQQGSFCLDGGTLFSASADLAKAIVCVDNGGMMSMSGGTIRGKKGHNSRGVFLQDTNGWPMAFTMTGGTIADCSSSEKGAGVLIIGKANFTMASGTITNCSAAGYGGGVAVLDEATFTMNGGSIESCSSGVGGYVYAAEGANFTNGGGTVGSVEKDGVARIGNKTYLSLNAAIAAVAKGQDDPVTIQIVKDMTISELIDIENRKIRLEADEAHTITFTLPDDAANRNCFRVAGYSTPTSLAIGENLTVTTTNDSLRSIVNVGGQQGSFFLEGGTLFSAGADLEKAIVCVDNGGTMSMSGGTIQGKKGHSSRGVFLQDTSTDGWEMAFTMTGGTITDCSSSDKGSGVLLIGKAHFTLAGGTITNCGVAGRGGGVAVVADAAFTMEGGEISSCTALEGGGGGVWAKDNAVFTLTGGKIANCQATANGATGGGICLKGKTITFTMSGGSICENTAEYLGGGIHTESDATITAGTIQNNRSTCTTGFGGGIYVNKEATLKLTNVVITHNTAAALGGGIWSCRTGDIKIYVTEGGAVFDNRAEDNGNVKTPDQAGDDIVSTVTFPAVGFLFISHRMLGGGTNRYYVDGGVTGFSTAGLDHHHNEGPGLGMPDGKTARYDGATSTLVTETYITEAIALKNVVSEAAKAAANRDARLMISGNSASRGGGIGTNGNLIIGTPDPDAGTGSLTVLKTISGSGASSAEEFSFTVTLNDSTISGIKGDMAFENGVATFALKAGERKTASGLPAGVGYTVEESGNEGYTVTINGTTGTRAAGTVAANTAVTVAFNNHKDGSIPPDKPDDNVPKTGDTSNISLWFALACFSLVGMTVSLLERKRNCK